MLLSVTLCGKVHALIKLYVYTYDRLFCFILKSKDFNFMTQASKFMVG